MTLRGVLDFFHIENFSNASEEEVMFFFGLHFQVCAQAKLLAREFEGKSDRAYRAGLSALSRESPAYPHRPLVIRQPLLHRRGNDAIEVVSAKGDLPPILLTGHQPESHHPLAKTWHDHIRQPLLNARPSLPSVLAACYRATLRVHRRFLCHRPPVERVCRMCRCIQAFLWWSCKTVS